MNLKLNESNFHYHHQQNFPRFNIMQTIRMGSIVNTFHEWIYICTLHTGIRNHRRKQRIDRENNNRWESVMPKKTKQSKAKILISIAVGRIRRRFYAYSVRICKNKNA